MQRRIKGCCPHCCGSDDPDAASCLCVPDSVAHIVYDTPITYFAELQHFREQHPQLFIASNPWGTPGGTTSAQSPPSSTLKAQDKHESSCTHERNCRRCSCPCTLEHPYLRSWELPVEIPTPGGAPNKTAIPRRRLDSESEARLDVGKQSRPGVRYGEFRHQKTNSQAAATTGPFLRSSVPTVSMLPRPRPPDLTWERANPTLGLTDHLDPSLPGPPAPQSVKVAAISRTRNAVMGTKPLPDVDHSLAEVSMRCMGPGALSVLDDDLTLRRYWLGSGIRSSLPAPPLSDRRGQKKDSCGQGMEAFSCGDEQMEERPPGEEGFTKTTRSLLEQQRRHRFELQRALQSRAAQQAYEELEERGQPKSSPYPTY